MDRPTLVHEGVLYTYKQEHGAWFEDPLREEIGTLCAPASVDGGFVAEDVGEIEISYYDSNGGVCEAECYLCLYQEDNWGVIG
jgi:hypothetical protein